MIPFPQAVKECNVMSNYYLSQELILSMAGSLWNSLLLKFMKIYNRLNKIMQIRQKAMFGSIPPVKIPAPGQPTGCCLHSMCIKGGGGGGLVYQERKKKYFMHLLCRPGPSRPGLGNSLKQSWSHG